MTGLNIVVFDLEIKEPFEANGYRSFTTDDFKKMGISCGALFDYKTGDTSVFLEDNLASLGVRLNNAALVVGFNIIGFDLPLLKANNIVLANDMPIYDMLPASRKSVGWKEGDKYPSGLRLDNHLLGTYGPKFVKTMDGKLAPDLYKQGRMGELISYCIADVRRERALFEKIWNVGWAATDTHGRRWFEPPQNYYQRKVDDLKSI